MRKAVLEIMDYAAAYTGNFLSSILCLSEELHKRDVETVLIFPERARKREWSQKLSEEGLSVYFLPESTAESVRLLCKVFREKNVIAVHTHFIDKKIYIPLKAVNLFKRVPHYFHAHSLSKQTKKDHTALIRRFLISADKILCVSDAVRESYERIGFKNCITEKNGICFSRLDTYEKLAENELAEKGKKSVLMFGYDFSIKGIDTAISALEKYDTEHELTLCICVASHMDKAQEFIKARFKEAPSWIKLLPPRNDVASYMREADVFLSASRTEGMPYAVIEAAYCKARIVLSDILPHSEIDLKGVHMFPVEDEKALYTSLLKALSEEKSDVNHCFVKKSFSIDKWAERVCSVILSEDIRQ